MAIVLDNTPPARPLRDQWPRRHGRPQIPHPDTGNTLDCYSPSSLTKHIGAGFTGNAGWEHRLIIKGAGLRPDIAIQAAPLNIKEDRRELEQLIDQAQEAGGRHAAANYGTALHSAFRRIIRGETPDLPAEHPYPQWASAVAALLAEHGVWLAWPDADETFVVAPELPAAGECDAYVTVNGIDGPVTLDLKTGSLKLLDAAAQLACYANATHMFTLDDNGDPAAQPIPEPPNTAVGLIVHAPLGDPPELVAVDLAAGWELARRCVENHQLTLNQKRLRVDLEDLPAGSTAKQPQVEDPAGADPTPPAFGVGTGSTPQKIPAGPDAIERRRDQLRARAAELVAHSDLTPRDVGEGWPEGCPTLKQDGHTMDTLELIEGHLALLETVHAPVEYDRGRIRHMLESLPPEALEQARQEAKKQDPPLPNIAKANKAQLAQIEAIIHRLTNQESGSDD